MSIRASHDCCSWMVKIFSTFRRNARKEMAGCSCCADINWAVCLDLTSTKGARVLATPRAQNSKNGEIAKNAFAMSGGVELGTSRVKMKLRKKKKEIIKYKIKYKTTIFDQNDGRKVWFQKHHHHHHHCCCWQAVIIRISRWREDSR